MIQSTTKFDVKNWRKDNKKKKKVEISDELLGF